MENNDSKKDLPQANPAQQYQGMEGENHSTAAEGTLKDVEDLQENVGSDFDSSEERDLDDLIHNDTVAQNDADLGGQDPNQSRKSDFTPDNISN